MYIESIKEGFIITNRNWQLVLLKAAVIVLNILGFLFFLGIPIIIAIVYMGTDLANLKQVLPEIMSVNPMEVLSKYLGLILLMITSLLLYATFASVLILYAFGGMLGVLNTAITNIQYEFTLSSFFNEAKKLFFPLLWLFSVAFLIITGVVIIFMLTIVLSVFILQGLRSTGSTFSVFITSFFSLLIIFLSTVMGLASVVYTVYAAVALIVEKKGVGESFTLAWNFIKNRPSAFFFYIFLVFSMFSVNIVLTLLGEILFLFPPSGFVLAIPYYLAVYGVQLYLGVVMWSSLLVFYIKGTNHPVYPIRKKLPPEASNGVYTAEYTI